MSTRDDTSLVLRVSVKRRYHDMGSLRRWLQILLLCLLNGSHLVLGGSHGGGQATHYSPSEAIDLGTTVVALQYDKGLIVAADSRTSQGTYVSNRFAHKLVRITDSCVLGRSGSAADTQHMAAQLRGWARRRLLRYGSWSSTNKVLSVTQAAYWLHTVTHQRSMERVSWIVAGLADDNMPHIYTVSPNGALLEEDNFAAVGSGSTFVLGFLDESCSKLQSPLGQEEAMQLCQRAIELAIARDGSSGGLIRMFVVDDTGCKELTILPPKNDTSAALQGFAAADRGTLEM